MFQGKSLASVSSCSVIILREISGFIYVKKENKQKLCAQSQAQIEALEGVSSSVPCSDGGVGGCCSKLRMWECAKGPWWQRSGRAGSGPAATWCFNWHIKFLALLLRQTGLWVNSQQSSCPWNFFSLLFLNCGTVTELRHRIRISICCVLLALLEGAGTPGEGWCTSTDHFYFCF